MKHTMKKANALILAALFVFTLLPMSAMAGVSAEYIGMTGVSFSHNMFIDGTCETEWEGNGRSTRIWLDCIFKKELGMVVDWSKVDKDDYLHAMERSPIKDIAIKHTIKVADSRSEE